MTSNHNNNLDDLLNELKSQYKKADNSEKSTSDIDNLLNEVKSEIKSNKISSRFENKQAPQNNPQLDSDLESIKAQYQNQQKRQKNQKDLIYNRNKQEIIIQEQQKQLKHKQLVRKAEKWLAQLDVNSDEGMWFNQLAESYPSKLEAAISYLSTLEQSDY